jgi:hypothetical protein
LTPYLLLRGTLVDKRIYCKHKYDISEFNPDFIKITRKSEILNTCGKIVNRLYRRLCPCLEFLQVTISTRVHIFWRRSYRELNIYIYVHEKLFNTHKTPFGDATVALITGKVKVFVTSLFFSP